MSEVGNWSLDRGPVAAEFWVKNVTTGAGITGLTNGDFTKSLTKDQIADATTVTVTEIGGGKYVATYTAPSAGRWSLLVTNATYNPWGWQDDVQVEAVKDSVLDVPNGVEVGITAREALQYIGAAVAGTSPASATTFNSIGGSTPRVASVVDTTGKRVSVSLL